MPRLLRKIEGEVITNTIGDVSLLININGEIQQEDFINLNGFIGFLQTYSKVESLEKLTTPTLFGLQNSYNLTINTIEIDY